MNAKTAAGNTALLAAAPQRDSFRVVSFLLEKGARADAVDQTPDFLTRGQGNTALMAAARSQDIRTLRLLLDRSLDPNAANSTGGTALVNAISAHNPAAFRLLLRRGAKADFHFGPLHLTPLMWAAFQDEPGMVSGLLKAGANVNAKDALQSTPLVWAAMSERDHAETVAALLAAGARTDVKTAQGETPLSWARRRGATEVARLLSGPLTVKEDEAPAPSTPLVSLEEQQAQVCEAVRNGIAALLPSGNTFAKQSECTSCHNNTVPLIAASVAGSRAVPVDAGLKTAESESCNRDHSGCAGRSVGLELHHA